MPEVIKTYSTVSVLNVYDIGEILTNTGGVGCIEYVSIKAQCALRCCSGRDIASVAIGRTRCG